MKKIISFFLLLLVILTGCSKKDPSKEKLLTEYPGLENVNHVYKEINSIEAIEFLNSQTGIIVFSFPTCPYCQAIIPILNTVAKEEKVKEIQYLDIYSMRKDNTIEYQNILGIISKQVDDLVFSDETQSTRKLVVPDVYIIKEGKIIKHHIATIKDDEDKWIKELNDEHTEEMKEIYRSMISKLK